MTWHTDRTVATKFEWMSMCRVIIDDDVVIMLSLHKMLDIWLITGLLMQLKKDGAQLESEWNYHKAIWLVYLDSVSVVIRKNLQWTGHLMRMSPDRLPKQVLYSQLSSGHRKRGHSRLQFMDTIKRNPKLRDIKIDSWTSLSQQRDKWRATVKWWKQSLSLRDRQHDDVGFVFILITNSQ